MATTQRNDESSDEENLITPDDDSNSKTVLVIKGLTNAISKTTLELLLENEKKSGGGEILKLDVDPDNSEAWVVFKSSKVAKRVLQRRELHFSGAVLTVEKQQKKADTKWDGITVYVTGVSSNMSLDALELIYESKRKSGGGPVETIEMCPDDCAALVTFRDNEDAENVLKQEIVFIEETDTILYAQKPNVKVGKENTNPLDQRRVLVTGFPVDFAQDTLELIYEKRKLSGGGPIASIQIQKENTSALVTFENQEDAKRVMLQKTLIWEGYVLTATLAQDGQTQKTKDSSSKSSPHIPEAWGQSKTCSSYKQCIQVSAIPSNCSLEYLRLYFENRTQSGGGDIEDCVYNTENQTAVIVFSTDSDLKSVMRKHHSQTLCISDSPLTLEVFSVAMFNGSLDNISPRAVEVLDLPADISYDGVYLLFENRKLTGGGQLEDCVIVQEQGRAVLTYKSHEVAKNVTHTYETKGISLDDYSLTVKMLMAKCKLFVESAEDEKDMTLLTNIPEDCQGSELEDFLMGTSNCEVSKVIFGQELGKAIVQFSVFPGFPALLQLICQRPLGTNMLGMNTVSKSTKIQVFGIQTLTEQRLLLYFEHPKSKGGSVESIEIVKEHDCAIIEFQDQQVALQVISHPNHMLEKKRLDVTGLYYECMGIIPPDHDTSTQAFIPKDITISNTDSVILDYVLSTPATKTSMETQFEDLDARIIWKKGVQSVVISCTVQKGMKDFVKKTQTWTSNVQAAFDSLMSGFSSNEINVLQEGWEEFKQGTVNVSGKYGEDILLTPDNDSSTMLVVGKRNCVSEAMKMLQLEQQYITEKLEKEKTRIQESITNLKPFQLKLLTVHNFPENMREKYKQDELTVHVDMEKCKMVVTGLPNDIQSLKLSMYEQVASIETDNSPQSDIRCQLYRKQNMRAIVNDVLAEKNLKIVWEISVAEELLVYGTSKSDVSRGMNVIKSAIGEKQVPLTEDSMSVVGSLEWIQLIEQVEELCNDMMVVEVVKEKHIDIAAQCDLIELAYEQIVTFLNENITSTKFYQMAKSKVQYILKYMEDQLGVNKQGKPLARAITDGTNTGFNVVGNSDEMTRTLNLLKSFDSVLIQRDHTISKAGIQKYFTEERGQHFVQSLEKDHQVRIEVEPSEAQAATSTYKKSVSRLGNGKEIYVVYGDLTEYPVDVIVNPANTDMKHGGGLAKAIVDKGGYEIDRQTRQYVQKHGVLLTGQACVTDAGSLPCKKVIHTVGPIWKGGKRNEENNLYQAVFTPLSMCAELKYKSIAIPAVSAGKYGYPVNQACSIIAGAVSDFLKMEGQCSIKEVHLVTSGQQVLEAFHKGLCDAAGPAEVTMLDGQNDEMVIGASAYETPTGLLEQDGFMSLPTFSRQVERPEPLSRRNYSRGHLTRSHSEVTNSSQPYRSLEEDQLSLPRRRRQPMFRTQTLPEFSLKSDDEDSDEDLIPPVLSSSYWQAGGQRYQVVTAEGLTVTLKKGDIVRQQADVIVNMTSKELNLTSGGAVSKNILKVGGQQIQTECTQNAPNGVQFGSVVKTSGGNMQCQKIYHGACNDKNHLKQYFSKCLTLADNDGISTIAFPSIGTGSMGIPADFVADMMYSEVQKFSQSNPNTSIQEVLFVVYDDKSTKSFEQHASGLTSSMPVMLSPASHQDMESAGYWQQGSNRCEILSGEGITVSLIKGSITGQEADVLVNLTSRELDLTNGAVSRAISQQAGPGLQAECKQVAPRGIQYGGFISTKGHKLVCKNVYHGACEKYGSQGAEQHLKQYIDKCLQTAHKNSVHSIAFPALGTGSLGFPNKTVAKILLRRIQKFSQSNPGTSIQHVLIVIYKSAVKEAFERVFTNQFVSVRPKTPKQERKLAAVMKDALNAKVQQIKDWWNQGKSKKSVTFRITGANDKDVEEVIVKLTQTCDSEVADKVFNSPSDQEFIKKLSPDQIAKIKQLESSHDVSITIETGQRINRIRVQGSHADTAEVVHEIHNVFREIHQRDMEESQMEILVKLAQWKFEDDDGSFQSYPKDINAIIEKAQINKQTQVEWSEEAPGGGTKKVRIEFKKMREFDCDTRDYRNVRRVATDDVTPLPGNWTKVTEGTVYCQEKLKSGSKEYLDVEKSFKQSMQSSGAAYNSVIEVQRIQNPSLYKKYQIHKSHMDSSNPAGTRNERTLWHGTSKQVLTEIMANGFNRMMGKTNRQWYGKGVYFATQAGLSAQNYTTPDGNGHKYLFRCKVLTGEYTKGSKDMIVPPAKNPNMPSVKYDSAVDNVNIPSEWVVFSDYAAYPEYLIQFN